MCFSAEKRSDFRSRVKILFLPHFDIIVFIFDDDRSVTISRFAFLTSPKYHLFGVVFGSRDIPVGERFFASDFQDLKAFRYEINRELDELERKQKEIQAVIERLTDVDERYVLLYRYMQGMKWDEISLEMHASMSTVKRWFSSGIKKIIVPK